MFLRAFRNSLLLREEIDTAEVDLPTGWFDQADRATTGCCFAAPRFAYEAEGLPFLYDETHIIGGVDVLFFPTVNAQWAMFNEEVFLEILNFN